MLSASALSGSPNLPCWSFAPLTPSTSSVSFTPATARCSLAVRLLTASEKSWAKPRVVAACALLSMRRAVSA
eukprot:4350338-Pleurochrysis_carterae.AAC.1